MTSNNSSCILDPMPTKLLKQSVDKVLPMITARVNKSLTHGHFLSDLKLVLIKPHLKKPSLDINELNHYRPVSNLHFLSKIIEKIVVSRLCFRHKHSAGKFQIQIYQEYYGFRVIIRILFGTVLHLIVVHHLDIVLVTY